LTHPRPTTYPFPNTWQLSALTTEGVPEAAYGPLPATVPGCVHTDLMAAGVIRDPYYDRNELHSRWIGRNDWRYTCRFLVTAEMLAHERLTLVCEGLDTVAEVSVNGHHVGSAENMHVGYRFEVKGHVREGENVLTITFRSPYAYAERMRLRLGDRPAAYDEPFPFIRKMACNFGWDWGPALVTVGVWRPLYLEGWSGVRLTSVRPLVTLATPERAQVVVHAALETTGGGDAPRRVRATLKDPAGTPVAQAEGEASGEGLKLEVPAPQLWWPRGHGAQPLYTLTVEVVGAEAAPWQHRIGLRSVALDTAPDEIGSRFALLVNGQPVFCRGANWIPDDCFPHRVTRERLRERLLAAVEANLNLLRVWGGGLYESANFYELCDELGLMVWQDFAFACAAYPEEAPFDALVEAEARYNLTRLARHPSLVLWNGNNENLWGYVDWGWQERLEGHSWGRGFYLETLPRLTAELDPSRPYWPGSPYTLDESVHPNDDRHGCTHIWDVWNERDYTGYRDYKPRFAAEFGFQAPPTYATLARSLPAPELTPTSKAMRHHQKAVRGNEKLSAGLEAHFGASFEDDFDRWHYLTQLNQARAVELGVTWFRSLAPRCMGALYWQLNDCWPVTSWAAVDGYGGKKPLWYATRRFFADRLLTFQPTEEGLALFACNDSGAPWEEEVTLARLTFAGAVRASEALALKLPPRSTRLLSELSAALAHPEHEARELLVARASSHRALWFFARDKDLAYPEPAFDAVWEPTSEGGRLSLTAHTLLRDVCLFADRLDPNATVSDQLVTLLPGERAVFTVHSGRPLDGDALGKPPVLWCVNAALRGVATARSRP
jgi:beta-mannosidase